MAAGNQHAVRAVEQRLDDEQRVNAARAGYADDTQTVGWVARATPAVSAPPYEHPVAEKTYNLSSLPFKHWHKAFTSARIWLSVVREVDSPLRTGGRTQTAALADSFNNRALPRPGFPLPDGCAAAYGTAAG